MTVTKKLGNEETLKKIPIDETKDTKTKKPGDVEPIKTIDDKQTETKK